MASRAIERAQLLDDYMLTVDAAETGQRGFLLTGDASYLAPFLKASSDISLTFSALESRFAGSRVEVKSQLDWLHELTAAKMLELARTVALRRSGDEAAALAVVRTNVDRDLMNEIHARYDVLATAVLSSLAAARQATQNYLLAAAASLLLLVGSVGLLVGAGYRREREANTSLQRLTTAFLHTQGMIRTLDGRIVLWSDGAAKLYGIEAVEAVGKLSHELLQTTFPGPLPSISAALLSNGQLVHRRRDGSRLIVASEWVLSQEDASRPNLVIEVNHDITENVVAREALALRDQESRRLAAIVDSSNDAIIGKDLQGTITSWNTAAEKIFGYAAADVVGQPIAILIPAALIEEERAILAAVRRGDEVVHFETVRKHKNGRSVPVSITVSPIRDSENIVVGASKIARDLTERNERVRRLSEVQKDLAQVARLTELGHVTAALAHEVNQPLTAIANYVNAARRLLAAENLEGLGQAVGRAAEQATRAAQIVQRLRAYLDKGKIERQLENLPKVIEDVIALALVGVDPEVRLTLRFDPEASEVVIDKVQIQQVLFNLMRNSVDAMRSSPRRELKITTASVDGMVRISVADTGHGLTDAVRANLFQAFNTSKKNGMGIGLSICRTIVEAHDGTISAVRAVGGGTVFSFTLPLPRQGQHDSRDGSTRKFTMRDREAASVGHLVEVSKGSRGRRSGVAA